MQRVLEESVNYHLNKYKIEQKKHLMKCVFDLDFNVRKL